MAHGRAKKIIIIFFFLKKQIGRLLADDSTTDGKVVHLMILAVIKVLDMFDLRPCLTSQVAFKYF